MSLTFINHDKIAYIYIHIYIYTCIHIYILHIKNIYIYHCTQWILPALPELHPKARLGIAAPPEVCASSMRRQSTLSLFVKRKTSKLIINI